MGSDLYLEAQYRVLSGQDAREARQRGYREGLDAAITTALRLKSSKKLVARLEELKKAGLK